MTNPATPQDRRSRLERRRDRIVEEIQRNRRGEYTVPTWVLTALLVAIVAAVAALVIFT
jgi:hypothetical protein